MDFENFLITVILLLFTLDIWTHDKHCEAWNNNLQCDGYHTHALKFSL